MLASDLATNIISGVTASITAVYVILTGQMLRAMRRDSYREHRLRHLDDIKAHVVQPLLSWIDSFAIPPLIGSALPLIPTDTPIPRPNAPLGDMNIHYRRHLEPPKNAKAGLEAGLFKHTKENHFGAELTDFEEFEDRDKQLLNEMAAVGRECADTIAAMTNLRRTSNVASTGYVDSDSFVAACFKDFLAGAKPQVSRIDPADGNLQLFHSHGGNFAHGPRQEIEEWWKDADAAVTDAWQKGNFAMRAKQLVIEAHAIAERIRAIEFTYNLAYDCEYITGRMNDAPPKT